MTLQVSFVGIDLAGDTGRTGVAIITHQDGKLRYHFPRENWKGSAGLQAMSELICQSVQAAVDQPFSYSIATLKLLRDDGCASGDLAVADYATRLTDQRMRGLLNELGLSQNYVMSPNRCNNIWRALALARQCGLSRADVCRCKSKIVETHPRVAWAVALSEQNPNDLPRLVVGYKGTNNQDDEMVVRSEMLDAFERASGVQAESNSDRQTAIQSADEIEALICAYVAMKHNLSESIRSGFESGESPELEYEGSAILPDGPWPVQEKGDG